MDMIVCYQIRVREQICSVRFQRAELGSERDGSYKEMDLKSVSKRIL